MIGTQKTAIKIERDKEFPERYFWTCSVCGANNRYFEPDCYDCLWQEENEKPKKNLPKT